MDSQGLETKDTPLAYEIVAALRALTKSDDWRRMFAGVVCHVTYERFLQACFVAQFNARPEGVFGAHHEFDKIDVGFYRIADKQRWWQACRPTGTETLQAFVCGLMELKICYPISRDAPWYKYGPQANASKVAEDIKKLRTYSQRSNERRELFAMLTIATFFPRDLPNDLEKRGPWGANDYRDAVAAIRGCEDEFWKALLATEVRVSESDKTGDVWLLDEEPVPGEPKRRAFAKAILIRVADG